MPNYFTKFSVVLKFKDTAQQQYAVDLAAEGQRYLSSAGPLLSDFPVSFDRDEDDWYFETEKVGEGIWLHSEDGGVDVACAFIQHLLQRFDPSARVSFQWSNDCGRPLLDAYGGGAAIITAKEIKLWARRSG